MSRRVVLAQNLLRCARQLSAAQDKSDRCSTARGSLPPGSSRARVTTANARWSRAAEERDRRQEAYRESLRALVEAEGWVLR